MQQVVAHAGEVHQSSNGMIGGLTRVLLSAGITVVFIGLALAANAYLTASRSPELSQKDKGDKL